MRRAGLWRRRGVIAFAGQVSNVLRRFRVTRNTTRRAPWPPWTGSAISTRPATCAEFCKIVNTLLAAMPRIFA